MAELLRWLVGEHPIVALIIAIWMLLIIGIILDYLVR